MRVICAQDIAEEISSDVYRHNVKSLAYITGSSKYFFKCLYVALPTEQWLTLTCGKSRSRLRIQTAQPLFVFTPP